MFTKDALPMDVEFMLEDSFEVRGPLGVFSKSAVCFNCVMLKWG